MPRKSDRPDIEIGAAVKAKRLRFERVPETSVRTSDGSRPTSQRRNLPDEVEPGVTYRDIEIRWHVRADALAREVMDPSKEERES